MPGGGTLTIAVSDVILDTEYVKSHPWASVGPHVCLAVEDTGSGIEPETLAQVFDPFFTTKGSGKGTGLGLAVVLGVAKQHGGTAEAISEVGRGSRFSVLLPAAEGRRAEPEPSDHARDSRGSEHVLLVEDHEELRDLVARYLVTLGYRVSEAGDGEQALSVMETAPATIDAVITDLVMPRMGGRELADVIRNRWPAVAMILTTGLGDDRATSPLAARARLVVVAKPYAMEGLAVKLRQVLDAPAEETTGGPS